MLCNNFWVSIGTTALLKLVWRTLVFGPNMYEMWHYIKIFILNKLSQLPFESDFTDLFFAQVYSWIASKTKTVKYKKCLG